MNFTEEQFKLYKDYSLSFLNITKECLPILTDTGKYIQSLYLGKDIPRYIVFCHDILKRVRENLFFLTIYPPQKDNSVPLQLILRCVFNDLIWLTYVVANLGNDEVLTPFLSYNDIVAIEGKMSFAKCEKEFMQLCGGDKWAAYFDTKIEGLSDACNEILSKFESKTKLRNSTIYKTIDLANYFKERNDLKDFYVVLYGPFKKLSQVEHYANENRSYSYFGEATAFFFSRFAVSYKIAIECLCKEIKMYIQNNQICDVTVELP